MAIYQRPLRPDELMHWGIGGRGQERPNHKYKERKWVNGAWQYIYDQAGGKYKKQANYYNDKAKRKSMYADYYNKKAKQYDKDAEINNRSARAYSKAMDSDKISLNDYKKFGSKYETHKFKASKSTINAQDAHMKSHNNSYESSSYKKEATRNENKYKNSLAGRAETAKKKVKKWSSNTMKTAKKYINSGQKKFNNFLDSLKPHTYVTFSDGTKYRIN